MTVHNTQITKSGLPTRRGDWGIHLLSGAHILRYSNKTVPVIQQPEKLIIKSPLYSISESLILKIFLGKSPPDPFIKA